MASAVGATELVQVQRRVELAWPTWASRANALGAAVVSASKQHVIRLLSFKLQVPFELALRLSG